MLKIMSFNANGIRSAARKGFFKWFKTQQVDVLCIQELKAQPDQLNDETLYPEGYHAYYQCAEKKVIVGWRFIRGINLIMSSIILVGILLNMKGGIYK